jgi:RNA polymerase sigma-70 factor, ECF subfamily
MHSDPSSAAASARWAPDEGVATGDRPVNDLAVVPAPADATLAYQQFCAAARDCERDLNRRAVALTHNSADAQDLTQRTLERGLRSLGGFQAGTNIRLWLTRIMVNLFIDDCRRSARVPRFEPLDEAQHGAIEPTSPEPGDEPQWARVTSAQVEEALGTLEPLFRQIYELRVRDNLRYHEIADRLQIPLGTVATRLSRARTKLQQHLRRVVAREEGAP